MFYIHVVPWCSYVFKLADFGTARELHADETFISLHGTEEYLYPGMYERALVNPTKRYQFSAQVIFTEYMVCVCVCVFVCVVCVN